MANKFMNHTKYSNWVIMKHADRAHKGKYPSLTKAFKAAARVLKCRPTQAASKYHALKNEGHKLEDFADFTQEDIDAFDPGDPEKISRSYPKGKPGSSHEEHFRGTGEKSEDDDSEEGQQNLKEAKEALDIQRRKEKYWDKEVEAANTGNIESPNPDTGDEYKLGYATAVEQAIKSLLLRSSKDLKIAIVKHIMKDL